MTKSELIMRLAESNPHLYQRDVERIVSTIFDEISQALENGDRVELRGFGAFCRNAGYGGLLGIAIALWHQVCRCDGQNASTHQAGANADNQSSP